MSQNVVDIGFPPKHNYKNTIKRTYLDGVYTISSEHPAPIRILLGEYVKYAIKHLLLKRGKLYVKYSKKLNLESTSKTINKPYHYHLNEKRLYNNFVGTFDIILAEHVKLPIVLTPKRQLSDSSTQTDSIAQSEISIQTEQSKFESVQTQVSLSQQDISTQCDISCPTLQVENVEQPPITVSNEKAKKKKIKKKKGLASIPSDQCQADDVKEKESLESLPHIEVISWSPDVEDDYDLEHLPANTAVEEDKDQLSITSYFAMCKSLKAKYPGKALPPRHIVEQSFNMVKQQLSEEGFEYIKIKTPGGQAKIFKIH